MSKLKERLTYRKFAGARLRVMVLDDDYYLQPQTIRALRELGHQVQVVKVLQEPARMLETILKHCVIFLPDCILSPNHAGFDPEGKIAAILEDLGIPVLVWYLDDFRFVIHGQCVHARSNTAVFTFEKEHVAPLRRTGFQHVFYLPSAASIDPAQDYADPRYDYLNKAVSFVGSTFRWSQSGRTRLPYARLVEELQRRIDLRQAHPHLTSLIREQQGQHFETEAEFYHYAGYAMCEATRLLRENVLRQVRAREFHIFGDPAWASLKGSARIHGPVHPEKETPHIFRHSLINLNISSPQLETTVNLRVFDVPAAGGFLLTDWKEELESLFEMGREVVCYHSIEEMNELIDFYQRHPQMREPIIRRSRQRVQANHRVIHRMKKMLELAAGIWRPQPQQLFPVS